MAIQEDILEEKLDHSQPLAAPVGHWRCVPTDMPPGPGVLTLPDPKGFPFVACGMAPSKTVILSRKPGNLGLLLDGSPLRHPVQNGEFSYSLKIICSCK